MKYFIGQLEWSEKEEDMRYWRAPDGVVAYLDLRNLAAQGKASVREGYVLMASEMDSIPGASKIVDAVNQTISPAVLDEISDKLAIPEQITVNTIPTLIDRILGIYSDPTIGIICPPLIPSPGGAFKVSLADASYVKQLDKNSSQWDIVKKVLQAEYLTAQQSGSEEQIHRQLLTVWQEKYGVENHEEFIPSGLPKETPLPHRTEVVDDFNRSDNDELNGQTASGGFTWSKPRDPGFSTGRIDVVSNLATVICNNANCTYRADSNLSSSDHFCELYFISTSDNGRGGPCIRFSDSAVTHYLIHPGTASDTIQFFKSVTGTYTSLGTRSVTLGLSTTYLLRLKAVSSTLQGFVGGVQAGSDLTDTAISGGLRGGIDGFSTLLAAGDCDLDGFRASDATEQSFRSRIQMTGGMQSLRGGFQ